jgi:hypothetical protein
MISSGKKYFRVEQVLVGLLVAGLVSSLFVTFKSIGRSGDSTDSKASDTKGAASLDIQTLEKVSRLASNPLQSDPGLHGMFVSELRVVAIGSAYPIPYEAEICPFSNIPQPAMNQLDRDGDEITDDWELKYGFNKYDASDAQLDPDGDGFSNIEEYKFGSGPRDAESHPPYARKLRFVDRKDIPFPLVFQGFTELQDGSVVFQLNVPTTGKSHFISVGEEVEGVVLQRFEPSSEGRSARLFVMRGSSEIELVRGEIALDPESKAELINILDHTPIMVTMGALLSLHSDEYMVLGVYADKVILKDMRTGIVFDVVSLADGER